LNAMADVRLSRVAAKAVNGFPVTKILV